MWVGICTIELYLPGTASLKDKRGIIKSIIKRIKNRYNVSVCELDYQNMWHRSAIGLSMVSNEQKLIDDIYQSTMQFIENSGEVQITSSELRLVK